jgi:spermidine synthase
LRILPERWLYSVTIGCSSVLLFLVQPIMAKAILPTFGGSAGVWVACMLFFQVALLMGYLYAYWITRLLSRKAQSWLHIALLLLSLWVLPLKLSMAPLSMAPLDTGSPPLAIVMLLAASVGLPYFVLSTTSPLMQSWYAGARGARLPYRLFALSNTASLLALLAYPIGIEPFLPISRQLRWWSGAYMVLVLLASASALGSRSTKVAQEGAGAGDASPAHRPLLWIGLAACASTLWLAVANHLSQEVAAIPFLWVLALGTYLLSFILCFERNGWYRPAVFRWLLPAACVAVCYRMARQGSGGGLLWEIPVFLAALFVCCMFCHGELALSKPERQGGLTQGSLTQGGLTFFYLMVALGGALGAVFVGIVAPNIFSFYLELPLGITGCVLLGLALLYGYTSPKRLARVAAVAAIAFVFATRFQAGDQDVAHLRNFYGALQVRDAGAGEMAVRSLYNGRTLHGVQFLHPARSRLATAFYATESGAGLVLQNRPRPRRVGVIGLGAGTLAVYGQRGDFFRFYEINPAVIQVALRYFHFLEESQARTDVVAGDGRLALQQEPSKTFDVIVVDAFSDDSIPVHLLMREAFQVYFGRLRDGGILAFHVTNRYLDLAPVIESGARSLQKESLLIHNPADPVRQVYSSDWVLVGDNLPESGSTGQMKSSSRTVRPWTDEYSNLFGILK